MCTALNKTNASFHYFGRNLDLNYPFSESIIVLGKKRTIEFKTLGKMKEHNCIYGVGIIKDEYPFFFDCVNQYGLSFAGLNFPNNAFFFPEEKNKLNLAPYELPLYFLGKYKSVKEIKEDLKRLNIADIPYSKDLPLATLHYMIADENECIVLEQMKDGLHIHDDIFNVLTNNPPFDYHKINLSNYMHITNREIQNNILKSADLEIYGKGMGAISLPGDSSPASRFIKATFLLNNIDFTSDNDFNIQQMFHVLNNVSSLKGEIILNDESREYTVYSDIYDTKNKTVYIRSYEDSTIEKHFLTKEEENSAELLSFKVSHQPSYKNI